MLIKKLHLSRPQTISPIAEPQHPLRSEYLTTKDLAAVLNTAEPVIRQSRIDGSLFGRPSPEFIRIGDRKLLYKASTIIEWIDAGRHGTVAGAES